MDGAEVEGLAMSTGIHLAARFNPGPLDLFLVIDRPASISNMMAMCGHPEGKLKGSLTQAFLDVLGLCLQDMRWAFELLGVQRIIFLHRSMLKLVPGWQDAGLDHEQEQGKMWLPHRLGSAAHRAREGDSWDSAAFVQRRMEEHMDRVMNQQAPLQWKILLRNSGGLILAAQVWCSSEIVPLFEVDATSTGTLHQSLPLSPILAISADLRYDRAGKSLRQQLLEIDGAEGVGHFSVSFDPWALNGCDLLREEGLWWLEEALLKVVEEDVQHNQLDSMELQFRGEWKTWSWLFTVGITDFDRFKGKRDWAAVPRIYAQGEARVMPYAANYVQEALDLCT
jgi:hypothetical protein